MTKFNVGQTVFYANYPERKIGSRVIQHIDIVDGSPRYWLLGYFGYFYPGILFETAQRAEDYIKNREAYERINEQASYK